MRGLDPRIHHSSQDSFAAGWIAGSSPAMTGLVVLDGGHMAGIVRG
jgi:hypothetical protein